MLKLAVRLIEIEAQSKPYSNRKVKKKCGGRIFYHESVAGKSAIELQN